MEHCGPDSALQRAPDAFFAWRRQQRQPSRAASWLPRRSRAFSFLLASLALAALFEAPPAAETTEGSATE